MTSDRGLCGFCEHHKKAKSYFAKLTQEEKEIKIITVGSKGNDQLKEHDDKIIENISFKIQKMQITLMRRKLVKL